jgi:DNA-directed RNA polymerase subunit RPC12/RpoP
MNIIRCPKCGVEIKSDNDIEYVEKASIYYTITLQEENLVYEKYIQEVDESKDEEYICANCSSDLPFHSSEEVKEYLIKISKDNK